MPRVILFPITGPEHIAKPSTLDWLASYLSGDEVARLRDRCGTGTAHVFGRQEKDAKKWAELDAGDAVLFTGGGRIHTVGTIALRTKNRGLGLALWPADEFDGVWDHLFVVTGLRKADIPYARFNEVVGYRSNYVPQGFRVLDQDKSAHVLAGIPFNGM